MLTREQLESIRADAFAEDMELTDEMLGWSEAAAAEYFESGGSVRPMSEAEAAAIAPLDIYCISDVHVEHSQNAAWMKNLPDGNGGPAQPGSVLLCGGDLATAPDTLRNAFRAFKKAYETVFFTPGNHDVWITCRSAPDSLRKYKDILKICDEEGVLTAPERLRAQSSDGRVPSVWVVPIASWYHASWDREPPLNPPPGMRLQIDPAVRHASSDEACCKWPSNLKHGSEELAGAIDAINSGEGERRSFEGALSAIADERAAATASNVPPPVVISMSHMLPRQELCPEKRHLFMPTLHTIIGSDFLRRRVEALRPQVHVFGHTHFAWDQTLDGIRYIQWCLATPAEQSRRVPYAGADGAAACKLWLPLPIWRAVSGFSPPAPCTYFSDLYKMKGRHPESCEMSSYTAAIFCPSAPIDEMIPMPEEAKDSAEAAAANETLKAQIARGQSFMNNKR